MLNNVSVINHIVFVLCTFSILICDIMKNTLCVYIFVHQWHSYVRLRVYSVYICASVAQLREAKEEKTAVEEDRAMRLMLNKAEVSSLSAHNNYVTAAG